MKIGLVAPVKHSQPYLKNDPAPLLDLHHLRISPWLWFRATVVSSSNANMTTAVLGSQWLAIASIAGLSLVSIKQFVPRSAGSLRCVDIVPGVAGVFRPFGSPLTGGMWKTIWFAPVPGREDESAAWGQGCCQKNLAWPDAWIFC